jgi:L-gulonolactone oxidase
MQQINEFEARGLYPITMVVFARFVKQSDSLLSPDYGRDSCYVEATSMEATPGVLEYYRAVENAMIERFDGRPHWAKHFNDLERVRGQYRDRLIAARAVRERWDPDGRFMNDFLDGVFAPFGGPDAEAAPPPP